MWCLICGSNAAFHLLLSCRQVLIDTDLNLPYDVLLTKIDVAAGQWGLYNFYKMQVGLLVWLWLWFTVIYISQEFQENLYKQCNDDSVLKCM